MEKLYSISPLDGRYHSKVAELREYFSELALINARIFVEGEYFIFLNQYLSSKKRNIKKLTEKEIKTIRKIYLDRDKNAIEVKKIEFGGDGKIKPTNHDVKAVEYYLKRELDGKIKTNLELIHFGLTSEDVNNISYSILISSFLNKIYIPTVNEILSKLKDMILKYHSTPFPARTHGQIASPTTFGKEIRVFYERINKQIENIKKIKITIKLNGAVGNYNSFYSAYPDIEWLEFTSFFVKHINNVLKTDFKPNYFTTQIEPHDSWIEIFDRIRHINSIFIGFSQDIWRYISDDLIVLKVIKEEVGSSTMPHKVNPINFENAEGNFQIANAILEFFSTKLPISRMQRDLTDSTVERNIGVAFGYTILAMKSFLEGLSKISLNEEKSIKIIEENPQVYAEAIQTVLRKHGIKNAYEILKNLTRGNRVSMKDIQDFIENMKIKNSIKKELKKIISKNYIGIASKLSKYKLEE
jgi:adenylosuccinate lyase